MQTLKSVVKHLGGAIVGFVFGACTAIIGIEEQKAASGGGETTALEEIQLAEGAPACRSRAGIMRLERAAAANDRDAVRELSGDGECAFLAGELRGQVLERTPWTRLAHVRIEGDDVAGDYWMPPEGAAELVATVAQDPPDEVTPEPARARDDVGGTSVGDAEARSDSSADESGSSDELHTVGGKPACFEEEDLDEMENAIRRGDNRALEHLIDTSRCGPLNGGIPVSILEESVWSGKARIRLYFDDGRTAEMWTRLSGVAGRPSAD